MGDGLQFGGIEFEISFSDITMLETNGVYEDVDEVMKGEWPHSGKWMLKTNAVLDSILGTASMTVHLYDSKDIYIIEYEPATRCSNLDIQCLRDWADQSGWNNPRPHEDLVRENRVFWKQMWETLLVDSDYLDDVYGKRPELA